MPGGSAAPREAPAPRAFWGGVAALPGEAFGRRPEELAMRVAYVDFDGAKALTASETIPLDQALPDDYLEYWSGDVLKAMHLIVDWINR